MDMPLLPPKGERVGATCIVLSVGLSVAKVAGLLTWSWLVVAAPALAIVMLALVAFVLAALLYMPRRLPDAMLPLDHHPSAITDPAESEPASEQEEWGGGRGYLDPRVADRA